jgi:leucyl-tRNA synthetase
MKGTIELSGDDTSEAEVLKMAFEKVERAVAGHDVKKTIYVKNRIVNIVLVKK